MKFKCNINLEGFLLQKQIVLFKIIAIKSRLYIFNIQSSILWVYLSNTLTLPARRSVQYAAATLGRLNGRWYKLFVNNNKKSSKI